MCSKVIMYYQTFCGLDKLLEKNPMPITHLHLSSIHFGVNPDNSPYIHLNDYPPNNNIFDNVWEDTLELHNRGVKIVLMIGGAGGAFTYLFKDFPKYYTILRNVITEYYWIDGVDLDVEEIVDLKDLKMLINALTIDFGIDFIISMAPVGFAMEGDSPGYGGFVYKELYNSNEGLRINYFNCQCYFDFSASTYNAIISNDYPASKIVMGMISSQFNKNNFNKALNSVKSLKKTYPDFGGVFDWEYLDAPPDQDDPSEWAVQFHNISTPLDNWSKLIRTVQRYLTCLKYNKISTYKKT